ncbi:MAG: hypothetical protein IJM54_08800 [Thermoguttaceae bacterium]|nr:hypothetical protein [Thermoguttaceae bacterium]
MSQNDDYQRWNMPPVPPENSGGTSPNAGSGDSTADLVRQLVRKSREAKNAGDQSAQTEEPAKDDPVARVLRRLKENTPGAEPSYPQPPGQVFPVPQESLAAPSIAPPPAYSRVQEPPVPTSVGVATPERVPVAAPPIDLPDVPETSTATKSRGKKNKRAKRADKKSKRSKSTPSPVQEADAAAIGALVGAVVPALPVETPDEFFGSVALNDTVSSVPQLSIRDLSIQTGLDADGSPDKFLEKLSHEAVPDDSSSAEELDFLRDESALEKAANDAPMWLVSLCVHLALIILLALIFIKTDFRKAMEIVSEPGFGEKVVLDEVFDPEAAFESTETEFDASDVEVQTDVEADVPDVSAFNDDSAEALSVLEATSGLEAAQLGDVENLMGTLNGDDLSGRGENKAAMLVAGGGSEGSEKSVALALAWIAEHQLPDGSWSFKMIECPTCGGKCRNSGSVDAPIAATSMALLPFLAAGNTPTQGKYKKVVAKGLNYLTTHGNDDANGTSFREGGGNMYSHGLATITLCETYAMMSAREKSRYRELGYLAQNAVRFIEYAQADDGGWRYTPKQAGDTSVAGWQLMGLKSAQMGGLDVRDDVVRNARDFLRYVSIEDETRYCYQAGSSESPATDSIGLLCRLYLDWGIEDARVINGVQRLSDKIGPQLNVPYYTYYATQLMYNVGGDVWAKWNARVRDNIIAQQCMEGHERGSWYPDNPGGHCATGGRLYVTSLNCMVLEVYYRHMPLYQKLERNTNFPIELPAKQE